MPGLKFGVYLPVYGGHLREMPVEEPEISYDYVRRVALEAEALGFDFLCVPDHMLNPIKGVRIKCLEAWTTLTAVAAITQRVKLCHVVLCPGFRYPAVLAKMSATLDEICQGRFIFSIGAGWFQTEFEAYGLPWYEHDERIEQAEEQIRLIRALWTQETVSFKGKYYSLENGILEPKPVQKPHPPIWYGGESERARQLIAREADCWLMRRNSPQEAREKILDMEGRLRGRQMEYGLPTLVFLAPTDDEAEAQLHQATQGQVSLQDEAHRTGLIGSPSRVKERILEFQEMGVNYLVLQFSSTLAGVKLFGQQVLKPLRGEG